MERRAKRGSAVGAKILGVGSGLRGGQGVPVGGDGVQDGVDVAGGHHVRSRHHRPEEVREPIHGLEANERLSGALHSGLDGGGDPVEGLPLRSGDCVGIEGVAESLREVPEADVEEDEWARQAEPVVPLDLVGPVAAEGDGAVDAGGQAGVPEGVPLQPQLEGVVAASALDGEVPEVQVPVQLVRLEQVRGARAVGLPQEAPVHR
eukprot:TRINITY_DN15692_c0_g1_i1.p2 TRINITY_DN15692_c0_g1~~TRINITY_DN15692_c0_g1_i1.p2  ORF type:complete len:205 (+),score=20.99 TRINITY_DN15692_c0_g1_i1:153-767(+)